MDRAAGAETVGAAAQHHRVAGLQARTPASAATLGRLSKITAMTPSGTRTRSMVMPFRAPAFGDRADRIGNPAHGGDAIGHRVDARRRQRQAIDEGGGRAAGADFGDILGIGGQDGGRIGANRAFDCIQRLVLLFRRRKRQHPRSGTGMGCELVHQGWQIGVAVDRLQRRGHVVLVPVKVMS